MFNFFKKKSKIKELPQKAVNVANSSDVSDLPSVASDLPSVAPVSSACEIEHDYRSDFKKCEHKLINFKSEKIKLSNFSKNSTQENLSYVSVGDFVKICHLKGKEGYWVVSEGGGIGDEIGKIPERLNPLIWQAPVIASFLYNSDCADSGKEVPTIEVFLDMPKNEDTPRVSLNNYFYTLKNLKKYVVFDIETTGLSYLTDEIIEIGLLKVENGEIIDKFSKLVNPNRRISDFINNLTGITNEDLKKAPSMNEIAKEVYDFLNGYVVVGHNVTFDLKFLKYAFCENKISAQIEYFDTLSLARELYPNFANHKLETLIKSLNISGMDMEY